MSKYKVGQVLYLLSSHTMKVFPVQIVEEVVRSSLKGKNISYTVMMPNRKKSLIELDSVNAKVFEDVEELREFMIQNTKNSIIKIIKDARTLQTIFNEFIEVDKFIEQKEHAKEKSESSIENASNVQINKNSDKIKVDIGNGIKANIKVEDLIGMPGFDQ